MSTSIWSERGGWADSGAAAPAGAGLDHWQSSTNLRWSMQNIAGFLPVRPIPRGLRETAFSAAPEDIGAVQVIHPWTGAAGTLAGVFDATDTDAWILVKSGAILAEHYANSMTPSTPHLLMSVSKSITATTAGILSGAGVLDVEREVADYLPALGASGYAGATVRHLLDMRTGVRFSEDYLDPGAEVRLLEQAIGWAPRRHPDTPATLLGFLAALESDGVHGGPFDYKSCETDALGFVIGAADQRPAVDVVADRLWQPMGAEFDASVGADAVGAGMFDGGISATLRDLARFGALFLSEGHALDGVRVVPAWWVDDTFTGGLDSREAFARATAPTLMPGGMYRNGFWFPREGADVMLALGIHGQMVYINRRAGVVGAKLSTWPDPQDGAKLLWTLRAFDAAADALS